MTTDAARALVDELRERAAHMGERTGEGLHLGRCLSAITDLASQIDALTAPPVPVDPPIVDAVEPKRKRDKVLSE